MRSNEFPKPWDLPENKMKNEINTSFKQQLEWKQQSYEKLVLAISAAGCEIQYSQEGIHVANRRAETAEAALELIEDMARRVLYDE